MPPEGERLAILSGLPDDELARRAAAGQLQCFEELLARYRDRVYRICTRSAGNAEDAADWAQECFVRAYRQLGRYDPSRPFAPWLLRVVANTCINLAKARERQQKRLRLVDELPRAASEPDPLERVVAAEEERLALRALDELSPPLRVAVVLRVMEDLSFRELAEILGVPLQTAATRVRRALEQVRRKLAQGGIEVDR
jgi:RNA polymerase sigma factor (sigma-70 family)